MFSHERRLKRGLSDISPLFHSEESREEQTVQSHIQIAMPEETLEIVSVWDAENPGQSALLGNLFAGEIANDHNPVTLLTLQDKAKTLILNKVEGPGSIKKATLSQNKFEEMWRFPVPAEFARGPFSCKTLVLEFDYLSIGYIEKMVALLDKWVLRLRPTMESLTETYKLIKATHQLNKDLEYYVLLEVPLDKKDQEANLFERFSAMTSKSFGISLNCAGSLEIGTSGEGLKCRLIENMFLKNHSAMRDTPEKVIVREWVESLQGSLEASA